jgi:hypothetical protein
MNASTFSVGIDLNSTYLTVTISSDAFYFMKYHKIGYADLYTFLSWSDYFISDNSGNFLAPFWDASVFG